MPQTRAGKVLGFDNTGNALDATIDGSGVGLLQLLMPLRYSATAAIIFSCNSISFVWITAAQTAQAAAEAALDTFDDDFLGSKASDPILIR